MSKVKVALFASLLTLGGVMLGLLLPPAQTGDAFTSTRAQGVGLYGYDSSGDLLWIASAREGILEDHEGILLDVELSFVSNESEGLQIEAESLTFKREEVVLSGNVVSRDPNGYRLKTNVITWIERSEELTAADVEIQSEGLFIETQRFRYNVQSHTSFLSEGVLASLAPPSIPDGENAKEGADHGTLSAEAARITADGFTALGDVRLTLTHPFFGVPNGPRSTNAG